MLPMGLTFSDQLKKLTLLTINSQEIGDLSAIRIIMKHKKGKEKMIYALKRYCGVIHAHRHKTGFPGRQFSQPLCKCRKQNTDQHIAISDMQVVGFFFVVVCLFCF